MYHPFSIVCTKLYSCLLIWLLSHFKCNLALVMRPSHDYAWNITSRMGFVMRDIQTLSIFDFGIVFNNRLKWKHYILCCCASARGGFDGMTGSVSWSISTISSEIDTLKPVCNDHLYDKIYNLWFIQSCVSMKTEGTNLFVPPISAFWSSRRQRSTQLGGRYRQVSLYYV